MPITGVGGGKLSGMDLQEIFDNPAFEANDAASLAELFRQK
jgi:hypothetical protein